jgi:hypothetical protein
MGNKLLERIAVDKYVVPLFFQTSNIADAAGTANAIEPASTEYVMPYPGSVVAITAALNGALSTGTVTFRPTINGTAVTAFTATALSSSKQRTADSQLADKTHFAAGDRLGIDWTKSGTVSPTTLDATITLWVLVELPDL